MALWRAIDEVVDVILCVAGGKVAWTGLTEGCSSGYGGMETVMMGGVGNVCSSVCSRTGGKVKCFNTADHRSSGVDRYSLSARGV